MTSLRRWVAVPAVMLMATTGCGAPEEADENGARGPVTIDSCGREVTFDTPPKSVLAVGSEAPSLLSAAGAGSSVTYYAGSLEVPFDDETRQVVEEAERVVEDSHELSFEMIVNTGVDTVIGTDITTGVDIDSLAARLEQSGIRLVTVSGYCAGIEGRTTEGVDGYDLIYRDVETYGRLFGTEDVADASVRDMKDRVATASDDLADAATRSAVPLYVPTEGVLGSYGGESLVSEQLEALGLRNVFSDVPQRYFEPSTEELVGREPDVVLGIYLPTGSSSLETDDAVVEELRERPELDGVTALDDDASVIALNYYYTSAGPLAIDGLELLADRLAPA